MSDEGYRLSTLLELRRSEEEARGRALADATHAAEVARAAELRARAAEAAAVSRREAEARAAFERAAAAGAEGVNAGDLVVARRWIERLDAEIVRARAAAAEAGAARAAAEAGEEAARAALASAAREREAISKHREQWEASRRKQREQRDEAAADDLPGSRGRR